MAKSYDKKIADAKLKIEQTQNRMKLLIQAQKKEERNARTKRLCSRMGLFGWCTKDVVMRYNGTTRMVIPGGNSKRNMS